ncbi:MAG TPA: WG repeat-containing protein, partial [Candidatus Pullichristensenella stercoripullorum]|nr:WG repeat-containing protein [Candidatus Pullichristensenella stercoripullorum]
YFAAYDGVVQAFDADGTRLYDYSGRLIHTASAQASYARGTEGQYILTDGPWGAHCCYIVRDDGTLVDGAWQSLFPLFTVEGTGYYGFMTFEATPVYVEELGEEQYEWDRDSALYGVVDDAGNTVLPAQYETLTAVADGRLLVREGERQGVIDVAGEWLYQLDTARE